MRSRAVGMDADPDYRRTMSNDTDNEVAVGKTVDKVDRTASREKFINRALWVLQIVVGLDFLVGAFMKLSGMPNMIDLFGRIGAGQWLRVFVGCCELAGGLGLLVPGLAGLAAIWLSALMVGAFYSNVFVIDDSLAPLMWLVLTLIIAWG